MDASKTMEAIAGTEAKALTQIKVMVPVKMSKLSEILITSRRGAAKLSPKVWQPKMLLSYCEALETAIEIPAVDAIVKDTHAGIQSTAWLAFAQMAAVLIETDDRQMLGWVSRSCDVIAHQINTRAPLTAETLSRVAEELREFLGVKDCACETCIAVVAVEAAEAVLDADAVAGWNPLVGVLLKAVAELIETIKTPMRVDGNTTQVAAVQVNAVHHNRERN